MTKKEHLVKSQYDDVAASYDKRWKRYIASTHERLEEELHLAGNESVLDVACGTGALEQMLVERHPALNITGVDISEGMLALARQKLQAQPNVTYKQAGASKLPFESDCVDIVVCVNAFHYFDEPVQALTEMRRVLKPGGRVIILDWCRDFLFCQICDVLLKMIDHAHKQCYYLRDLRDFLLQTEFRIKHELKFRANIVWGMMIMSAVK